MMLRGSRRSCDRPSSRPELLVALPHPSSPLLSLESRCSFQSPRPCLLSERRPRLSLGTLPSAPFPPSTWPALPKVLLRPVNSPVPKVHAGPFSGTRC
jgi:hypothetical protein